MSDTMKHELNRINTMTDKMLHVRYDKMTKRPKITAFFDALTKTGRAPQLREKIGISLGYTLDQLRPEDESNTYHYLTNGNQNWRFEEHDDMNIQIGSQDVNGDTSFWQFNHVDYANAYYPTDRAREFWNKLKEKGFVTCSLD